MLGIMEKGHLEESIKGLRGNVLYYYMCVKSIGIETTFLSGPRSRVKPPNVCRAASSTNHHLFVARLSKAFLCNGLSRRHRPLESHSPR